MARANRRILQPRIPVGDDEHDEQPVRIKRGPHVFDWCQPWHGPESHARCPGTTDKRRCECPRCNHKDWD